tara:strand:- start:1959 stop:3740 length:1782 start_codon:yes stop_codon:yes gene_type:complete
MKFKPTEQQSNIVELAKKYDIVKVSAGSGASKTTTIQLIANEIQTPSLYLAFNKSMATEAASKFGHSSHVECMTTHSLAYRKVGIKYTHKLSRPKGKYVNVAGTGNEIASFFRIPDFPVVEKEYDEDVVIKKAYIGLIIRDTVNKFEHSADDELTKEHIPTHHIKDIKKRYSEVSIKKFNNFVFRYAKKLWEERTDTLSEVICTHDTYLKLFQLKKLKMQGYEVIYLDEAQDTNSCVLDIFLNQADHAKLVLVGDSFQSIYQWRGSINAMQQVVGMEGVLTKSFRFGEEVAKIANYILDGAFTLQGFEKVDSKVSVEREVIDKSKPYTIIYRTNMNLLFDALDLLSKGESVNVNFDTSDFTKMVTSAVELFNGNVNKVKHEEIVPYECWESFKTEAKNQPELNRIANIVESGDDERVIKTLHRYKAKGDEKITLVTAHRSKGLEWDQVWLSDDFPSVYDKEGKFIGLSEAERNLLYVSATRAKKNLKYNQTVADIIDYKSKSGKPNKKGSGGVKVSTLDDMQMEIMDNDGLPTPKGDHAQDAVNRGVEEYFSPLVDDNSGEELHHGMSLNDFESPMNYEGINQDLKLYGALIK